MSLLSATSASASLYLTTSGNQILDADGRPIRLHGASWYGINGAGYVPDMLWTLPWASAIATFASLGFDTMRIPFAGDFTANTGTLMPRINPPAIDYYAANPDLVGLTAHQILVKILDRCAALNIRVILDMHQNTVNSGLDGDPLSGGTMQAWINKWLVMAKLYGTHPAVIGMDVYNEPHTLTWARWATCVETCANQVHRVAPHWLVFVEGVGNTGVTNGATYWWGGNLSGVAKRPISLTIPNRVVYSPHEYGQTGGPQAWLATQAQPVANYPANLFAHMHASWGYIFEQGIAPLWVGEFGGTFGLDGATGQVNAAEYPDYAYERQWLDAFIRYCNGEFAGDGKNHLAAGQKGISFSYWCFNGGPGQYDGMLDYNYRAASAKLSLLNRLFA
jgi:endoglucanase